jgi:hypothetical protein
VHEFVHGIETLSAGFPESFDGDIKADLVSVLEAVGHCLGGTGDTDRNPFDEMFLLSF